MFNMIADHLDCLLWFGWHADWSKIDQTQIVSNKNSNICHTFQ